MQKFFGIAARAGIMTRNSERLGRGFLLVGSYNGQDSLGDKCLLRAVTKRFRRYLPMDAPIYFHLHDPSEMVGELKDVPVTSGVGLQSYFWLYDTKMRHTHLPERLRRSVSEATFRYGASLLFEADEEYRRVEAELADSRFMFVFGGTNFSRQWWWMNIVPYMLSARMGRLPVYFGTQQYGPMTSRQQRRTRKFIDERVRDVRFRNTACMPELGFPETEDRLTCDEVFSNIEEYPLTRSRSGSDHGRRRVMVNFRGGQDFLTSASTGRAQHYFSRYLNGIGAQLDCDFVFFSMSGRSFCDDEEVVASLRSRINPTHQVSVLPYQDEYRLIEEFKGAYACISMSFHGCILSMIAGCPAIPVSFGAYYDHKYIGFDRYNPSMGVPVFDASSSPEEEFLRCSTEYFSKYDPALVAAEREYSDRLVDQYCRGILKAEGLLRDIVDGTGA